MAFGRGNGERERVHRHHRKVFSPVKAGLITLLVGVLVVYFGFSKQIPFQSHFEVRAVFEQANSVRVGSPVRIAGVNVGKVVSVERQDGSTAAVVTLRLDEEALPVHKDATLKIRPRIFLEGNFFVDLKPGTPSAPKLKSGGTIPITQTATPVQLDQVLTSLQADSRQGLQDILDGYGTALTHKPTAQDDEGQDPDSQGESAAQSLNDAFDYEGEALKSVAQVNEALLGSEPKDLSKLVVGLNKTTRGLVANERQLQALITNFDNTAAIFAQQADNLSETVRLLEPTIKNADTALTKLDKALPDTRAVAISLTRGLPELPETIDAAGPWITQTRLLLTDAELGGLASRLNSLSPDLGQALDGSVDLFKQSNLTAKCLNKVVIPTSKVKLDDGDLSTGVENYKDFFSSLVGLAGEGQNFDGNGQYIRQLSSGGENLTASGKIAKREAGQDRAYANTVIDPLGTRPKMPGSEPEYKTTIACYKSTPPDLNGPAADSGPASPGKQGSLP